MGVNIPPKSTVKCARVKGTSDSNGDLTIDLKIPGTFPTKTRMIKGGAGWWDTPHADDTFKVYLVDIDNKLGYGAGFVAGSYTDDDLPSANQGCYFTPNGVVSLESMVSNDYGELISELYLRIILKKGDNSIDTFRANIMWGSID